MTHLTAHQTEWLVDLLDREAIEHTGTAVPDDDRIRAEVVSSIVLNRAMGSAGAIATVEAHDGTPETRWQADRIGPNWWSVRPLPTLLAEQDAARVERWSA